MRTVFISGLTIAFLALTGFAQPLTDRLPDDAIVYVGWQGVDTIGEPYEQSNLKAMLDATDLGNALWASIRPFMDAAAKEDPNAGEALQQIERLAPIAWRRPWAFYLADAAHAQADPPFRAGFYVDAGADLETVRSAFQQWIEQAGTDDQTKIELVEDGSILALVINQDEQAQAPTSLKQNQTFQAAVAKVMPNPAWTLYVDGTRLFDLIDASIDQPNDREQWERLQPALGVDGLRQLVHLGGFVNGDWNTAWFIDAPAPRSGLLTLLDGKALTDDELKLIPATATWFKAFRLDPGRVLDLIRPILQTDEDDTAADFEEALNVASETVGVDIEHQLIRALGSAWVLYADPAVATMFGEGVVAVSPLNDSEAIQNSLKQLYALLSERMQQNPNNPFGLSQIQHGQMTIYSTSLGIISPSWSVHNGNLYVSLSPQAVATADLYATQPKSILDNPAFAKMRQRLPDQEPAMLMFADLPRSAMSAYQSYSAILQSLSMMAAQQTGEPMNVMLPPVGEITPFLYPAGSIGWSDDAGWHSRSISPFPGSIYLSPEGMTGSGMSAMGVGIMLPALGAARRTARQMQSNTQARGIHQACVMYSQSNNTRFPDDLATLYHDNYFTLEYMISPMSDAEIPPDFGDWPQQQQDEWVRVNSSYVLVPGLVDDLNSDTVALFLKPSHNRFENRGSVAWNDNHVTWETDYTQIDQLLREQTGKTMRQLIDEAEGRDAAAAPVAPTPQDTPKAPR